MCVFDCQRRRRETKKYTKNNEEKTPFKTPTRKKYHKHTHIHWLSRSRREWQEAVKSSFYSWPVFVWSFLSCPLKASTNDKKQHWYSNYLKVIMTWKLVSMGYEVFSSVTSSPLKLLSFSGNLLVLLDFLGSSYWYANIRQPINRQRWMGKQFFTRSTIVSNRLEKMQRNRAKVILFRISMQRRSLQFLPTNHSKYCDRGIVLFRKAFYC